MTDRRWPLPTQPESLRIEVMVGKIHRATITEADVDYVGSVTVDADLLDAAGLVAGQKVDVVDVTNGARLTTYTIPGERGAGALCMNGAAAHLIHPGDIVILMAYGRMSVADAREYTPRVVFVDANNQVVDVHGEPGQVDEIHALAVARAQSGDPVRSSGITFAEARADLATE